MDDATKKELQSATFERLIHHLRERKDVQNIDLMNLAGFCRNCLSRWYREEAQKKRNRNFRSRSKKTCIWHDLRSVETKISKIIMKKKEYYTEELEKSSVEKVREIEYQKYYTVASIVLMFLVLIAMYFVLK